jgi:hypothetical protein
MKRVGRAVAPVPSGEDRNGGGKSEQDRARWWLTATRGDPRESATENTQPMSPWGQVMVKWCGKSAPRRR